MRAIGLIKKFFIALAIAVSFCSVYFFYSGAKSASAPEARREMPVGKIELNIGDTRWKGESHAHHFRTWEQQRLYGGDSLYAGASSHLGITLGAVYVDLRSHTRLTLTADENLGVDAVYGQIEFHIPAGERVRVSSAGKSLDLSTVNGGRVNVQIEADHSMRVQNLAGDLVVRTEGKAEYTVPEEEIFSAAKLESGKAPISAKETSSTI